MTQKSLAFRIFTVWLSMLFLFLFLYTKDEKAVVAATDDQCETITIEECEIAAQKWILQNYQDETEIEEIIPIVTGGEVITSYCVSFVKNSEPNGYIIINADRYASNYLLEFNLSGKNIYDTLFENSGITQRSKSNKVIYSLGAFDYAIRLDGEKYYTNKDEIISKSEINEFGNNINQDKAKYRNERTSEEKKEIYDGFFTESTIPTAGFQINVNISGAEDFIPSLMRELRVKNGYNGNCTPTAATNLLSFYKEQRGFSNFPLTRQNMYDRIVSLSEWDQYGNSGMALSTANIAMAKTAVLSLYTYSSDALESNVISEWTKKLQEDYPVLTAVWGYDQTDSGWVEVGHSIVAVGLKMFALSGDYYLRVLDGWNRTNGRYIWFTSEYFTWFAGICVKLKTIL